MGERWYEDFFQGMSLELLRKAVPAEQTRTEADFLEAVLAPPPGARLLDVPCGNGRLALALAERGYRLTGVEQAAEFLAEGEAAATEAGLAVEWRRGDMRELPWPEAFHGAFCFGNSFGYFDVAGTRAFLAALAGALRPGARFVLDTAMVAESLLPGLDDRAWMPVQDMLVLVEHRYDAAQSRLETRYTIVHEGRTETRIAHHWVFTVGEVGRLLAEAGLATVDIYASLEQEPYYLGAPRLLLVAERAKVLTPGRRPRRRR